MTFWTFFPSLADVPKHLEEIDTSVSADENIRRLCFLPNGPLVDEFDQIFSEVFSESAPVKKDILRTLENGSLTATQIAERLGNERNGHLTRQLKELETAGFVAREGGLNPQTDAPLKIERLSEAGDSLHFVIPSDRH